MNILGLTPNTTYRVTVRAKNIRKEQPSNYEDKVRRNENLATHVEFRTLPKGQFIPHHMYE